MKPVLLFLLVVCPVASAQDAPLTIDRAIALAVAQNERAAIAEAVVEAAEARVSRARTAFFPRVDISGNLRGDYGDETERTLSTTAFLTQPLFDARIFPFYRQQRLIRDAARLNASETRRLLAYDAAATFLTTLSYEQVLRAAERRREFAQTNLDDVRARFEAGLVSSNDVTRAELELATAVRGTAQAGGDVQSSRVDLETLLHADIAEAPLAEPVSMLEAAAAPAAVTEATISAAQSDRTDIAAQRALLEAERAFAEEPAARFIPSLNLTAQTRDINDGALSNRNNEGFVGVSFAWPLFDAGVRNAERAERNAIVRGSELELELELREVERQMRGAAVQLTTEQASLREATAALRAAQKNADETNTLYREGLASALELADATQQLFEAEVALVTARYRMALAYLSLREAAGDTLSGERE